MSLQKLAVGVLRAGCWRDTAFGGASSLLRCSRGYATADKDSHDDFKPKQKAEPVASSDAASIIREDVTSNAVFLYMKGMPDAPQCGFSNMACQILNAYGVKFGARNVLADTGIREGVKKYSNWPTIPQVFVNGEFVGGADILMNMHEAGDLEKLFMPIIKEQQQAKKQ